MALGIQCVDSLAMRFSLHGIEDPYVRKSSFCFSWSEPFDLDSVAGKLTNPKRSHSLPSKLTTKKQDERKIERETFQERQILRNQTYEGNLLKRASLEISQIWKHQTRPCVKYANATTSKDIDSFEEESSDEELCELMAERENIPVTHELGKRSYDMDARKVEMCEKRSMEPVRRKRYLEELETSPGNEIKRPRPRLDFEKVRLSRTNLIEKSAAVETFAPIIASDSED
ncbi:predicted protein [Nematostella vectensis]|uniref:Uncharacterized protein n=1 Tax=Nematostella vectensis TaxID=45351 RepID=A7SC08_NEMVE|nr:uncharacterized protein LOC5510333 [Nematostella vectensis]XP_032235358.1 uncharacterized protein LOC5510333 [Nematostella vectensis]XP_032235359.1 uncharacterized protein LOC5510333 [Nematostella vectensis]XP_032235361.1 uncharacterized protein LOC5510333 [Nematostella vectensis]XP_032235362.1 uncharacterized protein LOC5510333 [Nematostella vectensis]XP_048577606.1 uncharacterized protein LOC5510333 [Nematostella vectensis]XP_048577607.1 uncharacterized protein LOC5510333 [Nematostella v|eukprot:XP_001630817.1 predicted protein [Nematostella vectensis]